jgi:uncharacterized protein YdaU (DUF1376 family)
MDACYDRERFPTMEEAVDWCWARSKEEIEAVEFVLKKFFDLVDGVYMQQRIADEIADFHAKSEKNKHIALEREANRRTKRAHVVQDRVPDDHEPPPNHKPLTINQEPVLKTHGYTPEFELAWAAYPSRPGASKADSFKAWKARIKDGAESQAILDGVERYASFCKTTKVEPQYIKQPATFFGPGRHFESEWSAPSGSRPSVHTGFDHIDYHKGVNDDLTFD